jgi:hypothetical protein
MPLEMPFDGEVAHTPKKSPGGDLTEDFIAGPRCDSLLTTRAAIALQLLRNGHTRRFLVCK